LIRAAEAVLLLRKIVVIGVMKTNDNAPLALEHDQKKTADNTSSIDFIITIMRHASVALALVNNVKAWSKISYAVVGPC
jgi:hypothetical protein